ncbi:hypothetical protein [Leifsonia shinshuensis]|uniref:Uncharacterized protein n=1 Tax=Leifsonia shinshuensis TaxID=150026 RepID=A0A853CZ26_9MICO|nr:hypothetical protein [Leifsonia shinshuensis]NYJ24434.1 hypothetical protein [Leifsonia shinshuensis]
MPATQQERRAAIREALVSVAEKNTSANRRMRNARRAWILIPAAATAVALTAGALVFAQYANVTDRSSVACFARPELNPFGGFPGTPAAVADENGNGPASIDDARALCADLWAQNILDAGTPSGTASKDAYDRSFSHPVPPHLAVCMMGDGTAAVVPGDDTVCAKLGLAVKR